MHLRDISEALYRPDLNIFSLPLIAEAHLDLAVIVYSVSRSPVS